MCDIVTHTQMLGANVENRTYDCNGTETRIYR
jgi:hypothetical protein